MLSKPLEMFSRRAFETLRWEELEHVRRKRFGALISKLQCDVSQGRTNFAGGFHTVTRSRRAAFFAVEVYAELPLRNGVAAQRKCGAKKKTWKETMRAVDLFCGVGGLSRGLSNAGIEIVGAYDNWPAAVETYEWNMRHGAECLDLLDVDEAVRKIRPLDPDMIVGGPPCQDFSSAGKRVEGSKASLTEAFAAIVKACKSDVAVMENVPRVRNSLAYQRAKRLLAGAGYSFYERVLDASLCGVPQVRKRFFMFAWRGKALKVGERIHEKVEESLARERLTVSDYMKDEISINHYYRHPRNYSRRAVFSVDEPSPTVRGVNRPVPPSYKRHRLDSASPRKVRPLTPYERSRIQTFPKSWRWYQNDNPRTKTEMELLIGNAVPVNLSRFVGRAVMSAFDG